MYTTCNQKLALGEKNTIKEEAKELFCQRPQNSSYKNPEATHRKQITRRRVTKERKKAWTRKKKMRIGSERGKNEAA